MEAQRAAEEAERKRIEEEQRKAEEEEKRLAEEEAQREEARAAKRERERVSDLLACFADLINLHVFALSYSSRRSNFARKVNCLPRLKRRPNV